MYRQQSRSSVMRLESLVGMEEAQSDAKVNHGVASAADSSTQVFFARVPPSVPYEELHVLFSKYGTVEHLNLYRRWATAKTSKGCGIVRFSKAAEAEAAKTALNGVYSFNNYPGCEAPMVVESMDPSKLTPPSNAAAKPKKSTATAPSSTGTKSTVSIGSSKVQSWQHAQQLNALAHARAAAAAAVATAVAAGCTSLLQAGGGGGQAALDAFGLCGMLQQDAAPGFDAGMVDSLSQGQGIPVQLLPFVCNNAAPAAHLGWQHDAQYARQLMPGAGASGAAAAALSQISPAAAASISPDLMSPDSIMLGPSMLAPGGPSPWAMNTLLNLAHGNCIPSSSVQLLPVPGPMLGLQAPVSAAPTFAQPLLPPEELWSPSIPSSLLSSDTRTSSDTRKPGACSSGSYSLFDSCSGSASDPTLQPCQLPSSGAASPRVAQGVSGLAPRQPSNGWLCASPSSADGASFSGGGNLPSRSLSCSLQRMWAGQQQGLSQQQSGSSPASAAGSALPARAASLDGCMVRPGGSWAVPCGGQLDSMMARDQAQRGPAQQQQGGLQALEVPLSEGALAQLAGHLPQVAKISGAEVLLTAGAQGSTRLSLRGTAGAVDTAVRLLWLLSPEGLTAV